MPEHIFFNVIRLPDGDDGAALEAWAAVGEWMQDQDGFLGSTLYRNRIDQKMLINKGRYETEEAFMASVRNPDFQALSQRLTDLCVERVAGLYDSVRDFGAGGN